MGEFDIADLWTRSDCKRADLCEVTPEYGRSPRVKVSNSLEVIGDFLAWLPHGAVRGEFASRMEAIAESQRMRVVRRDPYFLACRFAMGRFDGAATGIFVHSFPQQRVQGVEPIALEAPAFPVLHEALGLSCQFYNIISASEQELSIESDSLALKPYFLGNTASGTFVTSRLALLRAVASHLFDPIDSVALAELLLFHAPLGRRTIYSAISRQRSGDVLGYRAGGRAELRRLRSISLPEIDGDVSEDEAVHRYLDALLDSVSMSAELSDGDLAVPLSGGFDSRLLAGVCSMLKLPFTAYCYGRPQHTEVRVAAKVAETLGIPFVRLDFPADFFRVRIHQFLDCVEAQADLSTMAIINLDAIPGSHRRVLLHGFLGDVLGGAHIAWVTPAASRSSQGLARALLEQFASAEWSSVHALLGGRVSVEELVADIEDGLSSRELNHRNLMLWDLENRQSRYIGSQFTLLGPNHRVAAPYYRDRILQVGLSMPRAVLDGRRLTRSLLRSAFPALARIRHAEEDSAVEERPEAVLIRSVAQGAVARARRLVGEQVAKALEWRLERMLDRGIWHEAGGGRNRDWMVQRVGYLAEGLKERFGLDVGRALDGPGLPLKVLRGCYGIAEYDEWTRNEARKDVD